VAISSGGDQRGRPPWRDVIEFTKAELNAPKTLAELVREMLDGKNSVRTKDVADRFGGNYHTFMTRYGGC